MNISLEKYLERKGIEFPIIASLNYGVVYDNYDNTPPRLNYFRHEIPFYDTSCYRFGTIIF